MFCELVARCFSFLSSFIGRVEGRIACLSFVFLLITSLLPSSPPLALPPALAITPIHTEISWDIVSNSMRTVIEMTDGV